MLMWSCAAHNKIVGVGAQGSVQVPAGAVVRDVSGKYIVPGFVDTHAHWAEIRRDILEPNQWPFLANLAYGVNVRVSMCSRSRSMSLAIRT